jgi:hypothetical protein
VAKAKCMASNYFQIENYFEMINKLVGKGYKILKYQSIGSGEIVLSPYVILRHDVDFSLPIALLLAELEFQAGIQTTYFVHLRSSLYNPIAQKNVEIIDQIISMGHDVALHINYEDDLVQLAEKTIKQINILKHYVPRLNTKTVSFHKPGNKAKKLGGFILPYDIVHTYNDQYFEKISYFSDSRGTWKNGYPTESLEFKEGKSMQILTHPLWWIEKGSSPLAKLEKFLIGNEFASIELIEQTIVSYPLDSLKSHVKTDEGN